MKQCRIQTFYHRKRVSAKDSEGNTYNTYSSAISFKGESWPASGRIQAETYGERLPSIRNMRISAKYRIVQDDKGRTHYLFYSDGSPVTAKVAMKNGVYQSSGSRPLIDLQENDGICLFSGKNGEPDFRVLSVRPDRFLRLEVEKI